MLGKLASFTPNVDGELTLDGITLETETNHNDITIQHGGLDAQDVTILSSGHVTIDGGDTYLTGATIEIEENHKDVQVTSSGDITAEFVSAVFFFLRLKAHADERQLHLIHHLL